MRLSKRDPREQRLPQCDLSCGTLGIMGPSGFTGFVPSPTELWKQCLDAACWLVSNDPEA